MTNKRRVGLGPKAVAVLLAVALAPLIAAALLIGQMGEVAQNFASNQAARMKPPLEDAKEAYRELIASKKRLYHQIAERVASDLEPGPTLPRSRVGTAYPPRAPRENEKSNLNGTPYVKPDPSPTPTLREMIAEEPDLLAVRVERDGVVIDRAERLASDPPPSARHRVIEIVATAAGGLAVHASFAVDLDVADHYQTLGRVLAETRQVDSMTSALPRSYRSAFLALLGAVVLIASVTGIFLARRLTRRIDLLVAGTRRVAGGDLSTRVAVGGRDELGELGGAFDRMVEELAVGRDQILYLQRMTAWQDMARRLAHEIKNPLTPIQLAVQQMCSSYAGDDAAYKKLLAASSEIVGEEIAGLRRLVDAFRELGRLPDVDPQALDLAVVLDDLGREADFADRLTLAPPSLAVTVLGDRLLLRRVVANLIENGIHAGQACGHPGRVVVGWAVEPGLGRARLTVDDEGQGVAAVDRGRIFEPYVTSKESGTGLGLAIARKIALEHKGDLAVAPEPAPTGGARFILTVPLA